MRGGGLISPLEMESVAFSESSAMAVDAMVVLMYSSSSQVGFVIPHTHCEFVADVNLSSIYSGSVLSKFPAPEAEAEAGTTGLLSPREIRIKL